MKFESMISQLDEDDREILRGLYGENGSLMLKKANTYVHDKEASEDVVQDAVLKLVDKIDTLRKLNDAARTSYTAKTIERISLNYLKKKKRHQKHIVCSVSAEVDILDTVEDTTFLPMDERLLKEEMSEAVRRALNELPERDKNLLIYKYVMEMSTDEICAILDIKKDQFGMAVKRAKEKARKLLIKEGVYSD